MTDPIDPETILHLAKVVESSDDAIISKDLSGTIRSWNRAAERLFGYTAREAIGQSIRMIIPADRQGEEDEVLATIRAGRAVTHFETLRQRKDGSLVPISLTVSPIHDETGRIIGASKIVRDITARRDAEIAAQRLTAVVRSTDDAIVTRTVDGIITSWNASAERIFGYTAEEAIGRSVRMLIPDELQAEEDMVLERIRGGESVDHYETRRQRKDGSTVAISLTVSPIRDDAGRIVGASKIARDVSEQLRLRQLAEQHSGNTERLTEVGAVVASASDRETIVARVTEIATQLTGAEFGAFFYNVRDSEDGPASMAYSLAGTAKEAFAAMPHPHATALLGPTFRGGGIIRLDDVTQDPCYGRNPPFHGMPEAHLPVRGYLAVPVKTASGEVLGGLFFGHSKPAVFTAEHERLAAGVAGWASLALENARLLLEAREASRMKDEFLAVLSHELRTPLNAILGYTRLLRSGFLAGAKADQGLETVERNGRALAQIIEDVLDVSRIVSGKMRLDVQPVELALVVENAIATVRPAADAKGVRVQTVIDPQVGPVSGDPGRLQQVAWNLLSNAVKFTPKGGRVQVTLARVNSHIELTVSDTGIGIPAEFLPHVFERFRQADSAITRRYGGLGLGLGIVRHIIEMHGGTVSATSPGEGQGASFRVQMPLMIVHGREPRDGDRQHPRSEHRSDPGHFEGLAGVRIVAVDDEPDALSLLRAVLEAAGAEVQTFDSAATALGQLGALAPQALVVDLGMADMDGFEFIRRVRESPDPAVNRVPAAALTAFARSQDRVRALRAGFEIHLAKPIDPSELVASVVTLVRRGRL